MRPHQFAKLPTNQQATLISNLTNYLLTNNYNKIGEGATRTAYHLPNAKTILKLPLPGCVKANQAEVRFANNPKYNIRPAKCQLVTLMQVPCVEMEFVTSIQDYDDPYWHMKLAATLPWILRVQGVQVGKNAQGNIVAYDMGHFMSLKTIKQMWVNTL